MTSSAVGAECRWITSVIRSRRIRVRSIDITGVIPDPAVMNNTAGGGGSGSTKLPCGAASRTIVPGLTPATRCADRKPSGIALTVMVTVRAPLTGLDVNEYERHRQRPSTSNPMPMY